MFFRNLSSRVIYKTGKIVVRLMFITCTSQNIDWKPSCHESHNKRHKLQVRLYYRDQLSGQVLYVTALFV